MKILNQAPQCPKCQRTMVLRHAKNNENHKFYGCSQFPRCREILPFNGGNHISTEKKELRRIKFPSQYQLDITNWVLNGSGNAIINAGPGSGKTTLLEHLCSIILEKDPQIEMVVCMYNRHIQEAAAERGMPALTTHQMGLAAIKSWLGSQGKRIPSNFIDGDKVKKIVMDLITLTWDQEKWMIGPVCDIVSKLKNTLAPTDNDTIEKICSRFGIETNGSFLRMAELAREALRISNQNLSTIDFDDMLYLAVKLNIPVKQYKWILFDELQDANKVQLKFTIKSLAPGGRFLGVGDRFQSIYGFRGADPESMDRAKEAFEATELPLSITYRCAKSHVRLLNKMFPDQPLEAFEGNQEGVIDFCSLETLVGKVQDGDLVLSRVNAAMVKPCFALIKQGIKAIIRGRDIGTGLINLIEKFQDKTNSVGYLIELLEDYRDKEVNKLLASNKGNQAEIIQDRVDTIVAISEGCYTIQEIIVKIKEVFSDKKMGVVFSTVHRAKGDESNNVFILRPDLMPHPMAKAEWEVAQEKNVLWVALSRARHTMTFIGSLPSLPEPEEPIEIMSKEEVVEKSKQMMGAVYGNIQVGNLEKASEILDQIDELVDPLVDPKALQELIDELEQGLKRIK